MMNQATRMSTLLLAALLLAGIASPVVAQGGRETARRHQGRHVHTEACRRRVPATYRYVTEKIWVPGHSERVWVPPVYEQRRTRSGVSRVLVKPGHYETRERPGRFEHVKRKIKVPARWEYVCGY
jgi:hypothetical protein